MKYNTLNKLKDIIFSSFIRFSEIIIPLLLVIIITRLYEILLTQTLFEIKTSITLNAKGLLSDIMLIAKYSIVLFVIFATFEQVFKKANKLIFRTCIGLLIIISCLLVTYYSIAGVPLDKSLFAYSINEIFEIISSSQNAPWWAYFFILGTPAFYFIVTRKDKKYKNWAICTYLIITLASFFCTLKLQPTNKEQYLVNNKLTYFVKSITNGICQHNSNPLSADADYFQKQFPDYQFISTDYPFLYKDNGKDVLSDFLDLKETQPNFVFVIVEGLGREFSGKNSTVPSATPFLDSLANVGLCWNNCLSTSMRTIQALPSVFGALPMGKTGFMNLQDNAPEHNTLLKTLHLNNYETSFFYGGWLCFDGMCYFLKQNKIDHTLDEHIYDSVNERNSWGLFDDYMFREGIKSIDFGNRPRLDVYLTLTTHEPFDYPDKEKYTELYREITRSKNKEVSERLVYKYASYIYLDESLRHLIAMYRERPGFDNTIFVITGDHSFNTSSEHIEVHHVPLIIWSPMLKNSCNFDAIASHRDITPSVLAMLKNKYDIKTPQNVTWINTGLDTSKLFRCNTFSPLLDLSRNISSIISNSHFITDQKVYDITFENNKLKLAETDCDYEMTKILQTYRALDLYVTNNNALLENNSKNNGIYTAFKIETNGERAFAYQKNKLETAPYEGEKETVTINRKYPLNIINYEVLGNESQIIATVNFKIYIPKTDKNLRIVTEIRRGDDKIHWSSEDINGNWFNSYDEWFDFTTTYNMRPDNYKFKKNDVIKIYIWNPDETDAHLSKLYSKVKYTTE